MELRKFVAIIVNNYLNEQHIINENIYNVFHGINDEFDSFDYSKIGTNTESLWNGAGFYFSDSKAEASLYGNKIIMAAIKLDNPIDLTMIRDTSIQGSGLINFFSKLNGFENIEYEGRTILEISTLINDLENNFNYNDISFSDGTKEYFNHVWYKYNGKEYIIRNRTQDEIKNKYELKSIIISKILYDKYNINRLPIRISELMNPYLFTKIAKKNGYDGVIAQNSTVASGNEYVVFDKNNIKIIKNI